jgi:hypothetical protein
MTWREFLSYIRDDRVMKMRFVILMAAAALGLVLVFALGWMAG